MTVADAQHRNAQFKNTRIRFGRILHIHAGRTSGQNDSRRLHFFDLFQRAGIGNDFAVHTAFPHPPGNQLGVLGAKVNDQYQFVIFLHYNLFLLMKSKTIQTNPRQKL